VLHLQIKNIIKRTGLTLTKSRKKVLNIFLNSEKPLSLKQLRLLVSDMDRVTLFRILSFFEDNKIIHTIRLDKGQDLFALCVEECEKEQHQHNHIHFQCQNCEDVSCLPIKDFPVLSAPNYVINNLSINAVGICKNCY